MSKTTNIIISAIIPIMYFVPIFLEVIGIIKFSLLRDVLFLQTLFLLSIALSISIYQLIKEL